MNLSSDVAKFALANASDPELAAELAELAGPTIVSKDGPANDIRPKCSFPRRYVLACQRKNVALACYAIRNCVDPEVLDLVAKRAKRKAVRLELAKNPYLTNTGAAFLAERCGEDTWNDKVYQALRRRPMRVGDRVVDETLAERISNAKEDPDLWDSSNKRRVLELLALDTTTPAQVNQVLRLVTSAGHSWLVDAALMVAYQTPGERDHETRGLLKTTYSPLECLDLLSEDQQGESLVTFVNAMVSRARVERPIDAELTKRIVASISDDDIPPGLSSVYSLLEIFSTESIEYLSHVAAWAPVIQYHVMTDEQFRRVLGSLPATMRTRVFSPAVNTRGRLEAMTDLAPDPKEHTTGFDLDTALKVIRGSDDPLLKRLVAICPDRMKIRYLGGQWSARGNTLLPAREDVADLVGDIRETILGGTAVNVYSFVLKEHSDYIQLLAEEAPGVARRYLQDPALRTYVYGRLVDSGAPIEMALSHLDTCTEAGLGELCVMLGRMARLRS